MTKWVTMEKCDLKPPSFPMFLSDRFSPKRKVGGSNPLVDVSNAEVPGNDPGYFCIVLVLSDSNSFFHETDTENLPEQLLPYFDVDLHRI